MIGFILLPDPNYVLHIEAIKLIDWPYLLHIPFSPCFSLNQDWYIGGYPTVGPLYLHLSLGSLLKGSLHGSPHALSRVSVVEIFNTRITCCHTHQLDISCSLDLDMLTTRHNT